MENKKDGTGKGRLLLSLKQVNRLQGKRERDCTAKSKYQKQGPASQVMEKGWEANVQRLQCFQKALLWEPLFVECAGQAEMWLLFLAYSVSQGT